MQNPNALTQSQTFNLSNAIKNIELNILCMSMLVTSAGLNV